MVNVPDAAGRAVVLGCLGDISPEALTLLRACSFLAPADVPPWLVDDDADELPEPLALRPRTGALATLTGLSLARLSADGISVDPRVQAAVRDDLGPEGRRSWCAGAVRLVARAFPERCVDDCDRARAGALAPHVAAVTAHPEAAAMEPYATARLLDALAAVLSDVGRPSDARSALERAVAVAEAAYGPDDAIVASLLSNLGRVLRGLAEPAGARRCFERALAIDEVALGPRHPEVENDLADLAAVRQDLGDLAGAGDALARALAIAEAAPQPQAHRLATHLNSLGLVRQDQGDLAAAQEYLLRALAVARSGDAGGAELASYFNNLGGVLGELGDAAGAGRCFDEALALAVAALGPAHPTVAAIRHNRTAASRPRA